MRIFTTLFALLICAVGFAQTLPLDFETGMFTFGDFEGGVVTVIDNPDPSGENTSNRVARMVKGNGADFAGSSITLAGPIDFSNKLFKMKVWMPNLGDKVLFKVENSADPAIFHQREIFATTEDAWETLEIDFTGIDASKTYDKIIWIFDQGTVGDGGPDFTYYFDDIELVAITDVRPEIPIDFESNMIDWKFGDFDGGVLTRETNPDQSGINTSANVAKMVKNTGAPFAGSAIQLAGGIDFSTEKFFRMKVWTPNAGDKVLLKLENSGFFSPVPPIEVEEESTTGGAWETMEFDFSNINADLIYDKIVLIFELGTVGDGGADFTYYLDDIETFAGVAPPKPDLPITFENDTLDYDLTDFGGNASSIVVDPTDASNMVGQAVRTAGAESFAGTTMGDNGLENPIPFAMGDTKMKVRVWSPAAGVPVRMKAEDSNDAGKSVETEAMTTVAQQWETLEFDFANEAMGTQPINFAFTYDKLSIFFNFGLTMGAEETYFWDDVQFGPRITVVDIVVNSMDHDTLEAAVIAAELAGTLSGAGPFTLFAPTDAAFAALPAGVLDDLLMDPTGTLQQILLYHTIGANILSGDLSDGQMATTLQGEDITVTIDNMMVMINQATVTGPDITTDNGVVHVVDAVLLPPSLTSVETLSAEAYGIKVTPNPASSFFQIELPETLNEDVEYNLFDMSGKILKRGNILTRISEISTAELSQGTYFLGLRTEQAVYVQKVMIVR